MSFHHAGQEESGFSGVSGWERSAVKTVASILKSPRNFPANCSKAEVLRATRTSREPSAAKQRASSKPIPDDAPVTRTVSVSRSGFMVQGFRFRNNQH